MRQNAATVYLSPEQEVLENSEPLMKADWVTGGSEALETAAEMISHISPKTEPSPRPRKLQAFSKQRAFDQMAALIANTTESYSVLIFKANNKQKRLTSFASHSLSRDLLSDVNIGYGSGLVGWTAENKVRISVCPFERDATTLLYYSCDQDLKSFIAVPVLDARDGETLVGVIACDSKKSYAYSKVAEKVLLDCAEQTANLFELFNAAGSVEDGVATERQQGKFSSFMEELRNCTSEQELLSSIQKLPQDIVENDAVAVAVSSERGMGHASFYPSSASNDVEHRLMQIVCKHKKLKTHGKSVHSLPLDDKQQRSFLSIPIRMLDTEVGSLNLLSQPKAAFTSETIGFLESLAKEVGGMLERLRLRESALSNNTSSTMLSWAQFKERAALNLQEALKEKRAVELLRVSFGEIGTRLEEEVGINPALASLKRLSRFIEQVSVPNALCGQLYSHEFLLLVDSKDSSAVIGRLQRLLQRLSFAEVTKEPLTSTAKLGKLLLDQMKVSASEFPKEARSIEQLLQNCQIALNQQSGAHKAVKE